MTFHQDQILDDTSLWRYIDQSVATDCDVFRTWLDDQTELISQIPEEDIIHESRSITPLSEALLNSAPLPYAHATNEFDDILGDHCQVMAADINMESTVDPAMLTSPAAPSIPAPSTAQVDDNNPPVLFANQNSPIFDPPHLASAPELTKSQASSGLAAAMLGQENIVERAFSSNAFSMQQHMRVLQQQNASAFPLPILVANQAVSSVLRSQEAPDPNHFRRVPIYGQGAVPSNFLANTHLLPYGQTPNIPVPVQRIPARYVDVSQSGSPTPRSVPQSKRSASARSNVARVTTPVPQTPSPFPDEFLDVALKQYLDSDIEFVKPGDITSRKHQLVTPAGSAGDHFSLFECSLSYVLYKAFGLDADTIAEIIKYHRTQHTSEPIPTPRISPLLQILSQSPDGVWNFLFRHILNTVHRNTVFWQIGARQAYQDWQAGMKAIILRSYDEGIVDMRGRVKNLAREEGDARDVWKWAGVPNMIVKERSLKGSGWGFPTGNLAYGMYGGGMNYGVAGGEVFW